MIGMLDPNALICGRGIRCLRKAGIEVELFPVKFMKAVESQNRNFTRDQEANNNRLERSLNNSVTIQTGEAVLESWKHHLHAAKRNLVCCGTSLINVSGQIDSIVQKLKSISDFTADFYLLSPANSSGLIDTYLTTTQEDEFMTHLRKHIHLYYHSAYNFRVESMSICIMIYYHSSHVYCLIKMPTIPL